MLKHSKKQSAGHKWKPGQSGNPAGRPEGSRNRATLAMQTLLDGEGEKITRKAIRLALNGDPVALRLCLERLVPVRKDSPVRITLPKIVSVSDIAAGIGKVFEGVSKGIITPSEGATLAGLLEQHRHALESTQLELRLTALEEGLTNAKLRD